MYTYNMKSKYPIRIKISGNQIMVPRQDFREPELHDLLSRLGIKHGLSRSTVARIIIKKYLKTDFFKITGIDWTEAETVVI